MLNDFLKKYGIFLIPLLFLVYAAPGALDYVFHHPDEKYYTDAVIQMIDKEDYLTPYKADGTPRFLKPIATYWTLIASYKVLGVNRISSRLLFWLAGALIVGLVYALTNSLTRNREKATIAAVIAASNPLMLMSASRSIPDVLLTLFLTISAWGFIEIMIRKKPNRIYYWMAYMGAAFAFETKGIPAAAFAGISMLFLVLNPWNRITLKKLLKPIPIVVSVMVALSWFVAMYLIHGISYLESFFNDQLGNRLSTAILLAVKNGFLGLLNLIAFLLPWIIILPATGFKVKNYWSDLAIRDKAIHGFIGVWVVLILVFSAAVFKFYDRYLLPVIPLVAFWLAIVLPTAETRTHKIINKLFLILNGIILIVGLLTSTLIPSTILITGLVVGISVYLAWALSALKKLNPNTRLANGILLLYFNAFVLLYPLLMPNPGKQLVSKIHDSGWKESTPVYVYGNIRTASNIRIHSENSMNVLSMDTVFTIPDTPNYILIFHKKEQHLLDLKNHHVEKGSEEWYRLEPDDFPAFMRKTLRGIKQSGSTHMIAYPLNK